MIPLNTHPPRQHASSARPAFRALRSPAATPLRWVACHGIFPWAVLHKIAFCLWKSAISEFGIACCLYKVEPRKLSCFKVSIFSTGVCTTLQNLGSGDSFCCSCLPYSYGYAANMLKTWKQSSMLKVSRMLKDTWVNWGGALCSRRQGHIRVSLFLQSQ